MNINKFAKFFVIEFLNAVAKTRQKNLARIRY